MESSIKRIKMEILIYKIISKLSNVVAVGYTIFTMGSVYYVKGYNYIASINENCTEISTDNSTLWVTLALVLALMTLIKCFSLLVIIKLNNRLKLLKEKNKTCKRKQKTY